MRTAIFFVTYMSWEYHYRLLEVPNVVPGSRHIKLVDSLGICVSQILQLDCINFGCKFVLTFFAHSLCYFIRWDCCNFETCLWCLACLLYPVGVDQLHRVQYSAEGPQIFLFSDDINESCIYRSTRGK